MRVLAASSIAFAALAAGGCGGGSPSFDAARADRICRDARTQLAAVPRPASVLDVKPFLARALPILARQRKDVATLRGSDTGDAKALLERWDDVIDAARRAEGSADEARLALAMRATHAAKLKADAAADSAGVKACKGFSPFEYQKH